MSVVFHHAVSARHFTSYKRRAERNITKSLCFCFTYLNKYKVIFNVKMEWKMASEIRSKYFTFTDSWQM